MRLKRAVTLMACLVIAMLQTSPALADGKSMSNKQIVRDFYEQVFVHHRTKAAAEKYLAPTYIQHNPNVPTGRQPFIDFFEPFFKKNSHAQSQIKRLIAEGNLVVVHAHARLQPTDRGRAVVDIFRVENGKIVEHWDVMQAVPENAANENGMF